MGDVCSRPPIIIRSHDLHASDIRRTMGEIASYHERDWFSPFFSSCGLCIFWPLFGFPFCPPCDDFGHFL
jgi:hypothetical protein